MLWFFLNHIKDLSHHVNQMAHSRLYNSNPNWHESHLMGKTGMESMLPPSGFSPGTMLGQSQQSEQQQNVMPFLGTSLPTLNLENSHISSHGRELYEFSEIKFV